MEIKKIRTQEAIRYLGYKNSQPDEKILKIISDCEKEILSVLEPKYIYKILEIQNVDTNEGIVTFKSCRVVFKGRDIAKHLNGCEKAAVMACTASAGVDRLLRLYQIQDMTKAVVGDSLASAAIEQICDLAQKEISEKADGYTTWRFSCGYGDFPIETQREIVALLDTQKRIGLSATESCMLVPAKSVTAVFGISKNPIERKRRGCESCNLYKTCNFRKRGERCEF